MDLDPTPRRWARGPRREDALSALSVAAESAVALLDFGEGRRLERFGPFVLDRPAPVAEGVVRADPGAWAGADARYERTAGGGRWLAVGALLPDAWEIDVGGLRLELRPTPSGGVGLFPEQLPNVDWVEGRVQLAAAGRPAGSARLAVGAARPEVLHLFGHTGLLTLAAARSGAAVTHVDAARPAVAWARRNAERSGLGEAPIRWIADDALVFARREARRGQRYAGVVLDPPTYGHGRGAWSLERDLPGLLEAVAELTDDGAGFGLVTAHATGMGLDELLRVVRAALVTVRAPEAGALGLVDRAGRLLPAGVFVRWGGR